MTSIDVDAVGGILREVAEAQILPRWRNLAAGDITTKPGTDDLVTVADTAAEAALGQRLRELLPGSLVVGEETFAAEPSTIDRLRAHGAVWIIDPIDGTRAFTRGEAGFASMVALAIDGEPVAGWILQPANGDLYLGERGGGVRRVRANGDRARLAPASHTQDPRELRGIMSGHVMLDGTRIIRDRVRHRFRELRHMSPPGIDYPRVLQGEIDFTVYAKCLPWDHLPGLMLLAEVGWMHAKLDASPYGISDMTGGVMCAPSRSAWDAIRAVMTT